jgi:hypothetical protein
MAHGAALVLLLSIVQSHEGGQSPATPSTFPDNHTNPQSYYPSAHPYPEEPLERLRKQVPELKGLQPSVNQKWLPLILQRAGQRVDSFFRDTPNLIADEYIRQQELRSIGVDYLAQESIGAGYPTQEIRDEYLILLHGDRNEAKFDEYRMDKKGNRIDELTTRPFSSRFFVTQGFALSCVYFSTALQSESAFRYLGEQRIGGQNTNVVAFAQRPGDATMTETVMRGRGRSAVQMLVQGVAWVDESNFQIIKIQTDLLAPRPEVGLDRQTTEVTLGEVRLRDIASPLWLPKVVKVNIRFDGRNFRNEHHYTNYRQYRVSSKMIFPH